MLAGDGGALGGDRHLGLQHQPDWDQAQTQRCWQEDASQRPTFESVVAECVAIEHQLLANGEPDPVAATPVQPRYGKGPAAAASPL